MFGVMSAWLVGAGLLTWTQGLRQQQWPPPFVYLDLTVFMGFAALIGRANANVGGLLAWGSLLGLALAGYTQNPGQSVFTDLNALSNALFRPPSPSAGSAAGGGTF